MNLKHFTNYNMFIDFTTEKIGEEYDNNKMYDDYEDSYHEDADADADADADDEYEYDNESKKDIALYIKDDDVNPETVDNIRCHYTDRKEK